MHRIRWLGAASAARAGVAVAAVLVLGGCATFSNDGGFTEVAALTRERTGQQPAWHRSPGDADAARTRIEMLLRTPLTQQAAVEIALINNPALQADFQMLATAEADLVQAGRLRNPRFDFTHLQGAGATEIDRGVIFDVLALLTMPLEVELGQRRFARTQVQVAREAVTLAADTQRAWVNAVASSQALHYAEQVKDAADASAELAQRMAQAGNFSKLAQMQQQVFYVETTAQLARARQQAAADREQLTRILGLTAAVYRLPEQLPALPERAITHDDVERIAMEQRLDVLEAKRAAETTARTYDLARKTGFINVLDAGYASKSATGEPGKGGYELSVELPLFDFGRVRNARAEAAYMQAVERVREVTVVARSDAREAYVDYRSAYELARHYRDEVVPLRKRISEENLLRYNGMLISVFELMADSREQVASITAVTAATRDFWLADIGLNLALTAGGRQP